jgi:3-oxoacyl-[acyl-carrier protein] reductase
MDLQLRNKIALVTGASQGLGFATAHLLAEEGAMVAINSRNSEKLAKAAERIHNATQQEVIPLQGDLTDPAVPNKIIEHLSTRWNGLDILVVNAGGPPPGSIDDFDDAAWQQAIELSFLSQVRLIKTALPLLYKSGAASVLTITSYSVKQPIPNLILSNSIRAATAGLTKSLALELGGRGIRFNSILPAWIETERVVNLLKARAEINGSTLEEEMARQSKDSPLGRMGTPREFANAAVFLVSPAASFITGAMLTIDGGMYKGTF